MFTRMVPYNIRILILLAMCTTDNDCMSLNMDNVVCDLQRGGYCDCSQGYSILNGQCSRGIKMSDNVWYLSCLKYCLASFRK